jgi:hypothetical protein
LARDGRKHRPFVCFNRVLSLAAFLNLKNRKSEAIHATSRGSVKLPSTGSARWLAEHGFFGATTGLLVNPSEILSAVPGRFGNFFGHIEAACRGVTSRGGLTNRGGLMPPSVASTTWVVERAAIGW